MRDAPLVFVDIDTQRDFLEPGGALSIAGAEAILPNLARLSAFARSRGIPVLATACAHTLDEEDPEPFPPHCLVGTRGQERVEATSCPDTNVLAPEVRLEGDELPAHLTLQKRRYNAFTHPEAGRVVARHASDGRTFVVYGVATDYCVREVVLGLRERGCRVVVVVDAIRPVDPEAEPAVLTEFANRGAVLTLTDVICGVA